MNSQYIWDRGAWAIAVKDEKDFNRHLQKVRVIKGKLMEITTTCCVYSLYGGLACKGLGEFLI